MPASSRNHKSIPSIGKSLGKQAYKKSASFFFLVASAISMVFLIAAWLAIRSNVAKPSSHHISVLDIEIEGPEFFSNATDNEILASADRQSQTILEEYPNLAAAYNIKANRNYMTGLLGVAKATWSRALELDPKSSDAMLGLAMIALEAGEYQRTTELCEQCMVTSPGDPRIPMLLAESYLQDGQANKSVLVITKHIASQPTSVQALELLGTAYLNLRDYENAIAQFTANAIANNMDNDTVMKNLAILQSALFTLQQQQFLQFQLIQHLQSQLVNKKTDSETGAEKLNSKCDSDDEDLDSKMKDDIDEEDGEMEEIEDERQNQIHKRLMENKHFSKMQEVLLKENENR